MRGKPILTVDFDGVIHSYERGWQGGEIYGQAVPGFWRWATEARKHFQLMVYSSRSKEPALREAMEAWIRREWARWHDEAERIGMLPDDACLPGDLVIAHEKPPAFLTIDDRCVRFDGRWDAPELRPEALLAYRPWTMGGGTSRRPGADALAALMTELDGARAALRDAAAQFDFYAEQHAAKGTPEADAKAETNRAMAAKCREAAGEPAKAPGA